jgi:hypothetical protein
MVWAMVSMEVSWLSCSMDLSWATFCSPIRSAIDAEHGGDLLFGEQKDLQHQVIALIVAAAHAGLAHQDEAAEQDSLERKQRAEQGEGCGIEVGKPEAQRVHQHPGEE